MIKWPNKALIIQKFLHHAGKPIRGKRRTSYRIDTPEGRFHVKKVVNLYDGKQLIMSGEKAAKAELLARRVAALLNYDHVIPVTAFALRANKYFVVSPWQEESLNEHAFPDYESFFRAFRPEELGDFILFLYSIAADDAHAGNLIQTAGGHLLGLDFEQAFSPNPRTLVKILSRMSPKLKSKTPISQPFGLEILKKSRSIQNLVQQFIVPVTDETRRSRVIPSLIKCHSYINHALRSSTSSVLDLEKIIQETAKP